MVRFLAERSDTKSNVKLGGFRSLLQASYVSSHPEELGYNETACLWMTIYIYVCVCVCVCDRQTEREINRIRYIGFNNFCYSSYPL